jgi:hypothetical protein
MKARKKKLNATETLLPAEMRRINGGDKYIEVIIDGVTYRIQVP